MFLENSGLSNIRLLHCYEVFWIHIIDTICSLLKKHLSMGTEQGILSLRKDTFVGKKENTISYTRKVVYPWEKDLMVYVMMGIMLILHFFMLIKQTLSLLDETITSNITFRKSNVTNNLYTDTTDVNTIMNPLHFLKLK